MRENNAFFKLKQFSDICNGKYIKLEFECVALLQRARKGSTWPSWHRVALEPSIFPAQVVVTSFLGLRIENTLDEVTLPGRGLFGRTSRHFCQCR